MIPSTTYISNRFEAARIELIEQYRILAGAINGRSESWTPTLGGSITDGAVIYDFQEGWFHLVGALVDVWFSIAWGAHSGTGNLQLILPFEILDNDADLWVGGVSDSNITYASGTHLQIVGQINSDRGEFVTSGSGIDSADVAVEAAGSLIGYIRYIVKHR